MRAALALLASHPLRLLPYYRGYVGTDTARPVARATVAALRRRRLAGRDPRAPKRLTRIVITVRGRAALVERLNRIRWVHRPRLDRRGLPSGDPRDPAPAPRKRVAQGRADRGARRARNDRRRQRQRRADRADRARDRPAHRTANEGELYT
jgi:hypothetical protein